MSTERASHSAEEAEHEHLDELVDLESRDSFPASDPPSHWAGPPEDVAHHH